MKTMVKIWMSCVMLFFSFSSSAQDEVMRWACVEDYEKVRVKLSQLAAEKGVGCGYLALSYEHLHGELFTGIHICEAKSKEEIFIMASGASLGDVLDDKCVISVIVAGSSKSMADIQLTMEDVLNIDIYADGDPGHLEYTEGDATAYFASFHPKFQRESSEASEESQGGLFGENVQLLHSMNSFWQEDKELFWRRWREVTGYKVQ